MMEAFPVKRVLGKFISLESSEETDNKRYVNYIYQTISKKDFFTSKDTHNFDWDEYFHEASELNMFSTLIKTHEVLSNEQSDVYFFQTLDGKEFSIIIRFEENGPEVFCSFSVQDLNKNLLDVKQSNLMSFELFTGIKLSFLKSFVETRYNLNQLTKIAFEIQEHENERLVLFYKKIVLKHFPDFIEERFKEDSGKHFINLIATK